MGHKRGAAKRPLASLLYSPLWPLFAGILEGIYHFTSPDTYTHNPNVIKSVTRVQLLVISLDNALVVGR